jgi:long-chain fatty acid transport protein
MATVRSFLLLTILGAVPSWAAGPLQFQHGGQGAAQVGAFTARTAGAGSITYNPAAAARLDGWHFQAGFDFTAPRDDYRSATGAFAQDHLITEAPALYATYHLPEDRYPFAFGVGVENAAWYLADWTPVLFSGRYLTRRQELTLWSVHPVVAYEIGDQWSVGGGLRYYAGKLGEGNDQRLTVPGLAGQPFRVEVNREARASVDGIAFDLGVQYAREAWGWGFVADSGAELEGTGRVRYEPRDIPADPVLRSNLDTLLSDGSSRQAFDLPWELRTGWWVSPYPELRLELDLAWMGWSVVDETAVSYTPNPFAGTAGSSEVRRRDWDDTLSVRLGVEGDLNPRWALSGGLAWEPSPVPSSTIEPGFARGDAWVVGLGMKYHLERVSFDLGYSFYAYQDRDVSAQELERPLQSGTYESRQQVWAFSASWRR